MTPATPLTLAFEGADGLYELVYDPDAEYDLVKVAGADIVPWEVIDAEERGEEFRISGLTPDGGPGFVIVVGTESRIDYFADGEIVRTDRALG